MFPEAGWHTQPLTGESVNHTLPEDYVVVYEDSGFSGRPNNVHPDVRGDPLVVLQARPRYMRVEIRVRNAHDVVLVDRID